MRNIDVIETCCMWMDPIGPTTEMGNSQQTLPLPRSSQPIMEKEDTAAKPGFVSQYNIQR